MRMNEPGRWPHGTPERLAEYEELMRSGLAVDVTHKAPKWFSGPVAIEASCYDRLVAWHAEAQRRLRLHLDEAQRLVHMLDASGIAITSTGGCFICKAVDAAGRDVQPERHVLTLTNYGGPSQPAWLIHG
ncbi:hypothetical protein [Ramlibacter albus]|uniref:Uncharacterized protein n=1 Tax=Ramlibacter albus TaxID=2079448 RepID=A0A923MC38_9BURK|nr:hypothetical protein [Ramlibacter albus]MBC5767446.1 hypothetical protein [Ramlibacter albus]